MMRKLLMPTAAAILTFAAVSVSGAVHALGLGEIQLRSALNERLDAEIELLEAGRRGPDEIVARLASSDDFERVGVQRSFFLSDLRFEVRTRADGVPYIQVSSREAVVEPFLNFVVELRWPQGRMLKEYTLLLDPPTYATRTATPVAAPERERSARAPAGRVERQETVRGTTVQLSPQAPAATTPTPAERFQGNTYATDRDDTLWRIAAQTRATRDVSIEQQMLAIADLNPEAFIGGNINLLKAGYVLRLPDEQQARSRSVAAAHQEASQHHREWQARRSGEPLPPRTAPRDTETPQLAGQLDATEPTQARAVADVRGDGELRILAAGEGAGAVVGGVDAERLADLEAQLAATESERERLSMENRDIASRVDQLVAQNEQAQRQLEVRDQQLARLQQQLEAAQQEAAAAPSSARPAVADTQILGAAASTWAVLAGAVVAVAVALLFLLRRRAHPHEEAFEPLAHVGAANVSRQANGRDAEAMSAALTNEPGAVASEDVSDARVDADSDDVQPAEAMPALATGAHGTVDIQEALEEADIYIAYGRYQQASDLLDRAVGQDPTDPQVRLKMLEVCAATGDANTFAEHYAALSACTDDPDMLAAAAEYKSVLGDAPEAAPMPAAPESQVAEELEFSLDLDLERSDDEQPVAQAADRDAPLAFESVAVADDDPAPRGAGDELGGDLGLDFNPGTLARTARTESEAADDDTFDFDLDELKLDDDAPVAASNASKGDDELDGFDFLDEGDAATTKLDLARAYIDMGDNDGAREILDEVISEGSDQQQATARELMQRLQQTA
jgi:pilus assembly protein FimV